MNQQFKGFFLCCFVLLSFNLIFTSCNNQENDLSFKGNIGDYEARITLQNKGSKFKGEFTYINLDRPKIKLEGVLEGDKLRLSEFDDEGELTGIFNGKFDFETYKGQWFFPGKDKKVAFFFTKVQEKVPEKITPKQTNKNTTDVTFENLEPQKLLKYFFKDASLIGSKQARYKKDRWDIEVEYLKTEYFEKNDQDYALVFFW